MDETNEAIGNLNSSVGDLASMIGNAISPVEEGETDGAGEEAEEGADNAADVDRCTATYV